MTDTHALVRSTDPDTSVEAAEKIAPNLNRLQQIVLFWFHEHPEGLTDWELEEIEGNHKSTYRSRRAELTRMGILVRDGKRYQDGGWRAVWRLAQ